MPNLLFLDVDGVLNSNQFHADWIQKNKRLYDNLDDCEREAIYLENKFDSLFVNVTTSPFFNGYIAPTNLNRFNHMMKILGDTVQIVFSSDWRFIQDGTYSDVASLDKIKELFTVRGIIGNVIGATPFVYPPNRGKEIAMYLNEHREEYKYDFAKVLVLDDLDVYNSIIENLDENFNGAVFHCWIGSEYGLTADCVGLVFRYFGFLGDKRLKETINETN